MKITYNNVTIDFFNFRPMPKQVLMTLSGGLDSASLTYLICKHFPQIEIIPFTAADCNFPKDLEAAQNVVDFMQKEFPQGNVCDLRIYNINQEDRSIVPEEEIKKTKDKKKNWSDLALSSVSKTIQLNRVCQKIKAEYPKAIRCDAMTANPPIRVMQELEFYEIAERRRDANQKQRQKQNKRLYKPYINVDKKFVADIYIQNNLMSTLFPLTKSCVGKKEHTNNFEAECGTCFWCKEKAWAFD